MCIRDSATAAATIYEKHDILLQTVVFNGNEIIRSWTILRVLDNTVDMLSKKRDPLGRELFCFERRTVKIADIPTDYEHKPRTKLSRAPSVPIINGQMSNTQTATSPADGNTRLPQAASEQQFTPVRPTPPPLLLDCTKTLCLMSEFTCPRWDEPGEKEVEKGKWTFTEETSMHPFWAVRRLGKHALTHQNAAAQMRAAKDKRAAPPKLNFNCGFVDVTSYQNIAGIIDKTNIYDQRRVVFPQIVNTHDIAAGEELLIQTPDPPNHEIVDPPNKKLKAVSYTHLTLPTSDLV